MILLVVCIVALEECRKGCGSSYNPLCLVKCYDQYNECKRNASVL